MSVCVCDVRDYTVHFVKVLGCDYTVHDFMKGCVTNQLHECARANFMNMNDMLTL